MDARGRSFYQHLVELLRGCNGIDAENGEGRRPQRLYFVTCGVSFMVLWYSTIVAASCRSVSQ